MNPLLRFATRRLFTAPDRVLRALANDLPRSDRGAQLDAGLALLLTTARRLRFPKLHEFPPERARVQTIHDSVLVGPTAGPLARVEDRELPGPTGPLRARVYVPRLSPTPLPLLVYVHGGGWVVGSIDSHDGVCRRLAEKADCIVVSVDYRLAPEHRYPAAVEDTEAAVAFVLANAQTFGGEPTRVGVGGDSAGGNLATVACRRLRDRRAPVPSAQLLLYPGTDFTQARPSVHALSRGFYLERELLDYFRLHYLERSEQGQEVDASPLLVEDLRGLPPAIVVTAGFDPLRDEGDAYAQRLREAGVAVEHLHYETLLHGFANMAGVSRGSLAALDDAARALGRRLRTQA